MATADQQFCLRWNNHQSTLISVFDTLLENGTLVDCTLAAEGQYLKAHKVVLSACSPYLETLLSQHYEKHPIVILKDVKFSELKSMMDYMYRGEVNISQDQLGTFLKAAESLQIKGLSDNGDDARDVGSTASKRQETARPSVTQTRTPIESKRPAPSGESDASRDGSISPSSLRKRRRTRRPSQGDEPDSHVDTNACDLPNAQSTPLPVSVPNTSIVPTSVQSLPKQIVKQEPTSISTIPETGLKKEIMDPPSEPLLEPKTEYLDYMNNENSIEVEDLTLDDDDELDSSMDASRPGPSHGDMSNQGYTWPMSGDQSGTDEIFMAAQEAVGAAAGQRDSQDDAACTVSSRINNDEPYSSHSITDAKFKKKYERKKIDQEIKFTQKNESENLTSVELNGHTYFKKIVKFKCQECNTYSEGRYVKHKEFCHRFVEGREYECHCGFNYKRLCDLLRHQRNYCKLIVPEIISKCDRCDSVYTSKKNLSVHQRTCTGSLHKILKDSESVHKWKTVYCVKCAKGFSYEEFEEHVKNCKKRILNNYEPLIEKDNPKPEPNPSAGVFTANDMEKFEEVLGDGKSVSVVSKEKDITVRDYQLESGYFDDKFKALLRDYKCGNCGQAYKQLQALVSHKRFCFQGKKKKLQVHKCRLCGFRSFYMSNFKRHTVSVHHTTILTGLLSRD